MGLISFPLILCVTIFGTDQPGKFGLFFKKDSKVPFVGQFLSENSNTVTFNLIPEGNEKTFSKKEISGIIYNGSELFNRYLREYKELSKCCWIFSNMSHLLRLGYETGRKEKARTFLLYDLDKGWFEWKTIEGKFEYGPHLTRKQLYYLLGTVPVTEGNKNTKQEKIATENQVEKQRDNTKAVPIASKRKKTIHCPNCRFGRVLEQCPGCKGSGYTKCKTCKGLGYINCPACRGTGVIKLRSLSGKESTRPCEACNGTGKVICPSCNGKKKVRCPICGGKKKIWVKCPVCKGTSRILLPEKSKIHKDKKDDQGNKKKTPLKSISFINTRNMNLLATEASIVLMTDHLKDFKSDLNKGLNLFKNASNLYSRYFLNKEDNDFIRLLKMKAPKQYSSIRSLFRRGYGLQYEFKNGLLWIDKKFERLTEKKKILAEERKKAVLGDMPDVYILSAINYISRFKGKPESLQKISEELINGINSGIQLVNQIKEEKKISDQFNNSIKDLLKSHISYPLQDLRLERGVLKLFARFYGYSKKKSQESIFLVGDTLFPVYGEIYEIQVVYRGKIKSKISRQQWVSEARRRKVEAENRNKTFSDEQQRETIEESTKNNMQNLVIGGLIGGIVFTLMLLFFFRKVVGRRQDRINELEDPYDRRL